MRSRLVRTLYVLGLTVSAAAVAVPAQARDVKFNVPFTFVVNGETLPPGTYEVTRELSVLLVRGYDHGAAVVTARAEFRGERDPSLLFNRYGDRYILVEPGWAATAAVCSLPRASSASSSRRHGVRAPGTRPAVS